MNACGRLSTNALKGFFYLGQRVLYTLLFFSQNNFQITVQFVFIGPITGIEAGCFQFYTIQTLAQVLLPRKTVNTSLLYSLQTIGYFSTNHSWVRSQQNRNSLHNLKLAKRGSWFLPKLKGSTQDCRYKEPKPSWHQKNTSVHRLRILANFLLRILGVPLWTCCSTEYLDLRSLGQDPQRKSLRKQQVPLQNVLGFQTQNDKADFGLQQGIFCCTILAKPGMISASHLGSRTFSPQTFHFVLEKPKGKTTSGRKMERKIQLKK